MLEQRLLLKATAGWAIPLNKLRYSMLACSAVGRSQALTA